MTDTTPAVGAAGPVAASFAEADLALLIPFIGLRVVFDMAAAVPNGLLVRTMSFRKIALRTTLASLVAAVALPAYGAWRPAADSVTLQQVAAEDAQSLVVSSDSATDDLSRQSYSATTPEEIAQKKADFEKYLTVEK